MDSILPLILIIISAYLAYWFGKLAYLKQKSNEECRSTYLDEGIEALRKELAESHSTFTWNWSMALTLLKHVRDWKKEGFQVKPEDITDNFVTYRPKTLGLNYFDKVEKLIGDDIVTKWSFSAFGEINLASFFFTLNLAVSVRKFLQNPEGSPADGKTISKAFFEALEKHRKTTNRHFGLIDYLGRLSRRIRIKQISFEQLPKVKEDEEVKEIVKNMKTDFEVIDKEIQEKRNLKTDS